MMMMMMMMMSIEIASVLSHRVSQEAVNTCEHLNSTSIRLITDRLRYSCDVIKTVLATEATRSADTPVQGRPITRYASFVAFNEAY